MENCECGRQTVENCECHVNREKEVNDFGDIINENINHKEDELIDLLNEKITENHIALKKRSRIEGFNIGVLTIILFQLGRILMTSSSTIHMIIGVIFSSISIFIALPYICQQLISIYIDIRYYFIKNKKNDKN
tara:strand:- start:217 stop:618 length:402 start_codon:yes stop_codon:yes gene_type:complete